MRRSGRFSARAFRVSICCTCEDNESEPSSGPSTAPAGPRPGQSSRLTPRTEVGLGEGLGGPVARLPPGLQVRDDGSRSRRRSRALTQTGISEATLVPGSQRSEIDLNETHPPADHVTTTQQHTRMQDQTHRRRRRSLNIESSPRAHDTRQQRRRSLAMDNLPAQESRLEVPGRARGPANRSARDETRHRRRRSSQMDSSRRLESPVTGPEGHSGAPHERRQIRRRSLHIDDSPHRPELQQHRRRRYLQNPPHLSHPGEDGDLGRLAYPPLGVEHLFPESPSAVEPDEGGEGGASSAEKGSCDVKKGESSKDGAQGGGSA